MRMTCPGNVHSMRPGCPVSFPDSRANDAGSTTELLQQLFASSEMGDSMDADLLPELSGETWVAATYLDELKADLPANDSDLDFIIASWRGETLTIVRRPVGTVRESVRRCPLSW